MNDHSIDSNVEEADNIESTRRFTPAKITTVPYDQLAIGATEISDMLELEIYRTLMPRALPADRSFVESADAISNYLQLRVQTIVTLGESTKAHGSMEGNSRKYEVPVIKDIARLAFADDPMQLADPKRAYLCKAIRLLEPLFQNAITIHQLHEQTTTDSLTKLLNETGFSAIMNRRIAGYARATRNYAMKGGEEPVGFAYAVLDIDHFKKVNDTYGHAAGDDTLKLLSKYLKAVARRDTDTIVRFHGEEFGIVLDCAKSDARKIMEKLRRDIEQQTRAEDTTDGPGFGKFVMPTTVSIGLAHSNEFTLYDNLAENIFVLADSRMYAAKKRGRNNTNHTFIPKKLEMIVNMSEE